GGPASRVAALPRGEGSALPGCAGAPPGMELLMSDVVAKLWGFCHTLRHDGIDYGDYIEQITYLLFLKMADEKGVPLPRGCAWPSLKSKSGTELVDHYIDLLRTLGKSQGMLGDIY